MDVVERAKFIPVASFDGTSSYLSARDRRSFWVGFAGLVAVVLLLATVYAVQRGEERSRMKDQKKN